MGDRRRAQEGQGSQRHCLRPGRPWADRDGRGLARAVRSASTARNARCASEKCALRCCARARRPTCEGLCCDGGWFYATGSHALGRKIPDHQPSRHHVYRLRLEPTAICRRRDFARAGAAAREPTACLAGTTASDSTQRASAASISRASRVRGRPRCCSACAAHPWMARRSCSSVGARRTCSAHDPNRQQTASSDMR